MTEDSTSIQESKAKEAFSRQAPVFDDLYAGDTIIQYKRKRVRDQVERFLPPESCILELNAGTGEDAVYFAAKGHRVHATDISAAMQEQLLKKASARQLSHRISNEVCSFTELEQLKQKGPYDQVFSNFAGLNCTANPDKVLASLHSLVKPGGYVTLVLLPKFCLWEFLLLFRGKFREAFRRFAGKKGARAHVEGVHFRCWYYNPSYIRRSMRQHFDKVALEGLCTLVPPSYIGEFATKHPRWYRRLVKLEDRWKSRWPWRSVGDYYIITLQRKQYPDTV
ncbi:MAG: class I SAM-dependent methyltransferase [Chitinophagaceae bacterium]